MKEQAGYTTALDRGLRGIAALSMLLACLCLAALVVLFVCVIAMRAAGVSIPSADDIAVVLLGGTFALGFAAAVPGDQHISVDFFIDKIGGPAATGLRVLAYLVMILVVGYVSLGMFHVWASAFASGIKMLGTLPIPRALPMGMVLAGLVMLELALVLRFLQRLGLGGFSHSAAPKAPGEAD